MIKKIISLLCAVTCLGMLCGCMDEIQNSAESNKEESVSEASESALKEEISDEKIEKILSDNDKFHIFDLCGSLDSSEFSETNTYALRISDDKRINACALITDDLDGKEPSEYAKEYYEKLYDSTPGFLFLVNNDTGNDYIYTSGFVSRFITDDTKKSLLADISPLLVTGKVYDSIITAFDTFSELLPENVIDRTGKLSYEEIVSLDTKLGEYSSGDEDIVMLIVNDVEDDMLTACAEDAYEGIIQYSPDGPREGAILIVNPDTGGFSMTGYGKYEDIISCTVSAGDAFSSFCSKTENGKSYDFEGAADEFLKILDNFQ
ncbi:MAG: TPM domain-containing protein [Porcipelethomonas sp.]